MIKDILNIDKLIRSEFLFINLLFYIFLFICIFSVQISYILYNQIFLLISIYARSIYFFINTFIFSLAITPFILIIEGGLNILFKEFFYEKYKVPMSFIKICYEVIMYINSIIILFIAIFSRLFPTIYLLENTIKINKLYFMASFVGAIISLIYLSSHLRATSVSLLMIDYKSDGFRQHIKDGELKQILFIKIIGITILMLVAWLIIRLGYDVLNAIDYSINYNSYP